MKNAATLLILSDTATSISNQRRTSNLALKCIDTALCGVCVLLIALHAALTFDSHDLTQKLQVISEDVTALQNERASLRIHMDAAPPAAESPEPPFQPLDIALPEELQEYLFRESEVAGIDPRIVVAIGEHESGWVWPGEVMDVNGLRSVGYMQINAPHWERLADMGINVHTETGNIRAGIQILSELMAKYPPEKALVAYQCGETGAVGIESTEFSRWVLETISQSTTN